jgi:arylsulfatase A-like enzyme
VLALALGLLGAACRRPEPSLDLLAHPELVADASAAGQSKDALLSRLGHPLRIHEVQNRALPAGPPSRWSFTVDVPRGARFQARLAIPDRFYDRPGVEFVLKARRGDREEVVFSRLVDPLARAEDRGFLPVDVDLARHAGKGVALTLETRGFEDARDPWRAAWAAPALTGTAPAPLVVVYLVDTLRADHTGPYGYRRKTTPELDAFAQEAVVFEQAVATASWTKPAVASLLTSLLPGQHGAVQLRDTLDAGHLTLPEMLKAKGFATGAAIANSVIYLPEAGFDQGFDYFEGLWGADGRPSKIVEAGPVVDAALRFVDSRRGLPAFLYMHTMDPHVPYTPPPPFDRAYEPFPVEGHPAQDPRTDFKEPLDRERMIAQYDGEIAYGDREFGRFVRGLKARGLYDRALVVFLADHGEEFQDHGQWLHGRSVFDELVRVPLLVKFPEGAHAGRRVASQVQVLDVLPTVLTSLGLPVPPAPAVGGRPLQAALLGEPAERPAVSEISHRGIVAHGIRTARDKYVRRFSPESDELYFDLLKDPQERTSALARDPERVRALRARGEQAMTANPFRYVLRAAGAADYALTFSSSGWIEAAEGTGLGPGEGIELADDRRSVLARLRPRPGAPREIAFNLRPRGVPITLAGTRDGRPLRADDVRLGQAGFHPPEVPFRLPQLEAEGDEGRRPGLLAAADDARPGLAVWLVMEKGRTEMAMDQETCERMKALGYVGTCAGS